VMDSWIVPESWAAAQPEELTRYPYNVDEANRLLDQVSSLDSDGDGIRDPIALDLLTIDSTPLRAEIARLFKDDMAKVGIVINIQTLPSQQFYAVEGPLYRRQFHLAQFAWIAAPDPGGLSLWSCPAVPNENNGWTGNNFAGWCFRDADQAIRVATTAQSVEERKNAYQTQQKLFSQELPSLPLFQRLSVTFLSPDMTNVQPDSIAPVTWNVDEWMRGE
jgi:peptide/nickel transport system substrate-binding protein